MEKLEVYGNYPQPRFGHTVTLISKTKVILFGGATGDTGRYSITGDTYIFDLPTRFWKKIDASGTLPSPRAAHAAVAVESNQLVVYGGATGGTSGSLASDDLYLLDLKSGEDNAIWNIVPVVGPTPGRRYGHTLTYTKPFLVVFGGNTGSEPVNDFWCLNVEKSPFSWQKNECKGEVPNVRVYHSASLCQHGTAMGMIVIFGGRTNDQSALNDSWGLRRHRTGLWDWVKAPYKPDREPPVGRYQHSSLFVGSAMLILGGRTNNVGENVGMEVYDTETSEWFKLPAIQRFRHASWIVENMLYVYGGFEHDSPNIPTDSVTRLNLSKIFQPYDHLLNKVQALITSSPSSIKSMSPQLTPNMSPNTSADSSRSINTMPGYDNYKNSTNSMGIIKQPTLTHSPGMSTANTSLNTTTGSTTKSVSDKIFRLATNAVIAVNQDHNVNRKNLNEEPLIKKVPIDKVQEESKKLINSMQQHNKYMPLMTSQTLHDPSIHAIFLTKLLQPKYNLNPDINALFDFKPEHIIALCDQAQAIIESQPMVLKVRSPIKIYGDIHGQYSDLMRFFDLWGTPCHGTQDGDIESFDYLFLGDFVDRGSHSLETICLLLAMKIRYPEQVHLIRGNHEDKWINNGFGFSEECAIRLGEDPNDDDSIFNKVNRLFEYLPLAAIIEDRVICLHGGIGSSLTYVEEIEQLQRPLEVIHEVQTPEQQLVVDILWSDPTDSDTELGIQQNTIRDPGGTGNIVKFGPDRVQKFLNNNNLSLIIRAHECVMDGFERFAGGQLITVFSATDYCARHKNAGAVLILKKNFEIIPKLIYPQGANQSNWIEDEEALKKRPPTPPRWKNNMPRKASYDQAWVLFNEYSSKGDMNMLILEVGLVS